MIAAHVLLLPDVPLARVLRRMRDQRRDRHRFLQEFLGSYSALEDGADDGRERLHSLELPEHSAAVGRAIGGLSLPGARVTALVRRGERRLDPPSDTRLEAGDVLVLAGTGGDLERAEQALLG